MKQEKQAKQEPKQEAQKVLSREEILAQCKPIPSRVVQVQGWPGGVRMRNIPFAELVELRTSAPDKESYHAMFIAAACEDLNLEDAYKLQKGNGIQFSMLLNAVNEFLGLDLDAKVKN